jgi:uncharacterized integral membrane protein
MADPGSIDPTTIPAQSRGTKNVRRDRARLLAAGVIGALVAAFALLNLDDVKVHWLFATAQTPLILVIVLAFLLGVVVDRLLVLRARRRQRARAESEGPVSDLVGLS